MLIFIADGGGTYLLNSKDEMPESTPPEDYNARMRTGVWYTHQFDTKGATAIVEQN